MVNWVELTLTRFEPPLNWELIFQLDIFFPHLTTSINQWHVHVDIFELKPETKNQKLIWKWVFHIHKRISIWNFFNKSFKKKCFDITIRVIKRSRKHKIWTTVIYIYQLKNIFCFFFLSNLSFHLGWNYKPEIKLYQMNSETHNFLCKYTQQELADKTW